MPNYEYIAKGEKSCAHCHDGFTVTQSIKEESLQQCPVCKESVRKVFSSFSLGASKTGLDQRAPDSGLHRLKRVDKGKYEKLY